MQVRATLDSPALERPQKQAIEKQGIEKQKVAAWVSLAIAGCIISTWAISIAILLTINLQDFPWVGRLSILPWQTFLYTGLFVTAHDAMHGSVCAQNRRVNDAIGTLVLILYGLFSYRTLLQRHIQHHRFPGSEADPDYNDSGVWRWYWTFMVRYWSWTRFVALVIAFQVLHGVLGISESNLAWAWVYPSILSSLHLFYFGTYLPHRQPDLGYPDEHRSTTIPRPWVVSLLACYHFGYHCEHHQFTSVPWWQLPAVHHQQKQLKERLAPPIAKVRGAKSLRVAA
jgi:beta-carotene/zeaxanthin 4-ketolase